MSTQAIALWAKFEEARAWGAKNLAGFPAWRVVPHGQGYVIELIPGSDSFVLAPHNKGE